MKLNLTHFWPKNFSNVKIFYKMKNKHLQQSYGVNNCKIEGKIWSKISWGKKEKNSPSNFSFEIKIRSQYNKTFYTGNETGQGTINEGESSAQLTSLY